MWFLKDPNGTTHLPSITDVKEVFILSTNGKYLCHLLSFSTERIARNKFSAFATHPKVD
jgi:hypothetical protein